MMTMRAEKSQQRVVDETAPGGEQERQRVCWQRGAD
jgi:hypothetical protein